MKTNRKFGVEFEAYNVNMHTLAEAMTAAGVPCCVEGYNHTTREHWKVVSDGSLYGLHHPFELVSPVLSGEEGHKQVRIACEVMTRLGAKVNQQCGLHVYVDATDYGTQQVKNIVQYFGKLEPFFDSFMPRSRRNNNFCKSVLRGFSMPEFFGKIKACNSIDEIRNFFRCDRYYKLNLESLVRHGTVEFRQHNGTVDAEKALNWIKLTTNFVELTASYAYVQLNRAVSLDSILLHCDAAGKRFYKSRVEHFANLMN